MNIKPYKRTTNRGTKPNTLPGLNRSALAKDIGISRVCVSRVLGGYCRPRLEAASKIAKALSMSLDGLFKMLEGIKAKRKAKYKAKCKAKHKDKYT
jgi:DNA-binding XRE family transcriptional regulator